MSEAWLRDGSRRVELYVPVEIASTGKRIETVTIKPVKFGHTERWRLDEIKNVKELLCILAGLSVEELHELTMLDFERCMLALVGMLPDSILASVQRGQEAPQPEEQAGPQDIPPLDASQQYGTLDEALAEPPEAIPPLEPDVPDLSVPLSPMQSKDGTVLDPDLPPSIVQGNGGARTEGGITGFDDALTR